MSATAAVTPAVRRLSRTKALARSDKVFIASATICVILVLLAIFGPLLAPYDPSQTNILETNAGPSAAHLLGTDSLGRDVFSRVLAGARLSVVGAGAIALLSATMGVALAIAAAWRGGAFNRAVARLLDLLFAFPGLLFAVLAVAVFGQGLTAPVIALAIAYTPYMARIVHSVAIRERALPYVEACELAGMSSWRICLRHLLPNLAPIVLAQITFAFASALTELAAISFLGLGVQPPSFEWGLIVSEGRTALLDGWPQTALAAGAMIVITVVATNVLGERLVARNDARRGR